MTLCPSNLSGDQLTTTCSRRPSAAADAGVAQKEMLDVVEQRVKLEVIVKMKTANALGLTIPTSLPPWADQVIA